MAVRLEILTDATVTLRNGEKKKYQAIYPTHKGLVIGSLSSEMSIFEKSRKRKFGFSKPIETKHVEYYLFKDEGFLRDGTYTFFTGEECHAYNQKLTNGEIRNELF